MITSPFVASIILKYLSSFASTLSVHSKEQEVNQMSYMNYEKYIALWIKK